jgi:hypothetical protein
MILEGVEKSRKWTFFWKNPEKTAFFWKNKANFWTQFM